MSHVIVLHVAGDQLRVDGRDVAAARGLSGTIDPDSTVWRTAAEAYVDAHPRPEGRIPDAQRLQILRRLAAGPATTGELLAAMRTVGWVGGTDLENRLRDLRGGGRRGAGRTVTVPLVTEGDRHRLTAPLPALDEAQLRAIGFVKSLVATEPAPLAAQALQVLDGMLPGVGALTGQPTTATMTIAARDMHAFEEARVNRLPVLVTYYSMNSHKESTYRLVPVSYVPVGPALKAVCIDVDDQGTPGQDRQFALDRVRAVRPTGMDALEPQQTVLRTEILDIEVTDPLYRIMKDRNQFNIATAEATETDLGRWRVRGEFPVALGWDVMEQMSAWAGQVMVNGPYWLANAVVRRYRAGLRAMEDAELELVKAQPDRAFASLEDAIYDQAPDTPPAPDGPRKLTPPTA